MATLQRLRAALVWTGKLLVSRKSMDAVRAGVVTAAVTITVFFAVLREQVQCFTNILAYVALVIIAQIPHIGAVFRGSCILAMSSICAGVFALTGLAMADKSPLGLYFVTLLFAFIAAILRTDTDPVSLGMGISVNFLFGAVYIYYAKTPPSEAWSRTYPIVVSGLIASAAALLGALVIFPVSARVTLRRGLAKTTRELSALIGKTGDLLMMPGDESRDCGQEMIARFLAQRTALATHRNMLSLLPYEPNFLPPWQCEPDAGWMGLLEAVEQVFFRAEALACALRGGRFHRLTNLGRLLRAPLRLLQEYFQAAAESGEQLARCIEMYPQAVDVTDSVNDHMRAELNDAVVKMRRRQWRNLQHNRGSAVTPSAFELASLIFAVYNAQALQRSLVHLHQSIDKLYAERRRLRFAPVANLFRWTRIVLSPIRTWLKTWTLLRNTDNLKFLIKYLICVAIIVFPTLFVAQFSERVFEFLQHDNAISAYIIVTILFMRGIEMTLFRVVLYFVVTFASSALGYAVTVIAPTDQYVLDMWVGVWTYGALLVASIDPAYIVTTFPFLLAQYFIIACQYGHGYTFVYAASRAVSVSAGCFVVAAVSYFIWPYRTESEVRRHLTTALQLCMDVIDDMSHIFTEMNAAGGSMRWDDLGGTACDGKMRALEGLLTVVRIRLQVDMTPNFRQSSLWRGANNLAALVRRLVLMRQVVCAAPHISGYYSDTAYEVFLKHLETELRALREAWRVANEATCARLGRRRKHRPSADELRKTLREYHYAKRMLMRKHERVRAQVHERWREHVRQRNVVVPPPATMRPHEVVPEAAEASNGSLQWESSEPTVTIEDSEAGGPPDLHVDDSVRFLTWLYSLALVMQAFEQVAVDALNLGHGASERNLPQRMLGLGKRPPPPPSADLASVVRADERSDSDRNNLADDEAFERDLEASLAVSGRTDGEVELGMAPSELGAETEEPLSNGQQGERAASADSVSTRETSDHAPEP